MIPSFSSPSSLCLTKKHKMQLIVGTIDDKNIIVANDDWQAMQRQIVTIIDTASSIKFDF